MNTQHLLLRLVLTVALAAGAIASEAGVRLSPLFSDGMVLQRDRTIRVTGYAAPGEKINISIANRKGNAVAGPDGRWTLELRPMKAGGPYAMRVNELTLKDVMVGDVFLCSGQSNMELTVARVMDKYADMVEGYENTRVRYLKVPYSYEFGAPSENMKPEPWKAMTADNVKGFSALCYFFGRILQEKTSVPVGIVNASWGGTPVEAWISEEGLADFPEYVNLKSVYEDTDMAAQTARAERRLQQAWSGRLYEADPGVNGDMPWYDGSLDDSSWETVDMFDREWATRRGRPANGTHWFRQDVELPSSWAGKEAVLRLGCMVDADSVYVNGRFVGTTSYQYPPRVYNIPAGLLREGTNRITVRLFSYGGRPSFVREKPYKLVCGDSEIPLGSKWRYRVGAQMPPSPSSTTFQNIPVGLYNGMIYPLRNYTFKGVAWYQGESNVGRWGEYAELLGIMMKDWRRTFGSDLPFYVIELADFLAPDDPGRAAWAELRKQQAAAVKADGNATLIKNSDTGEWNDIHPLDKKTPAERLVKAVTDNSQTHKLKN